MALYYDVAAVCLCSYGASRCLYSYGVAVCLYSM